MPSPSPSLSQPLAAPSLQDFTPDRLDLLRALATRYRTSRAALAEAAGLAATLDLPMGLVHIISDVHGEDLKLRHVIHNASGALRPLVEATLKDRLSTEERRQFLSILYYPREALAKFSPEVTARGQAARTEWVHRTLGLQCEIIRALRRTYRRERLERLTPPEFRELFTEMLSGQRPDFPKAILAALGKHDRDWETIIVASRLIRNLASAEILVAGDLGDRGPRIDRVIDLLIHQPGDTVNVLWGNHDAIWMGSALGHDPCILTVLRFSARYRRAAQLEEGYGILTTPLEKLVRECYADDPAEHFKTKGSGLRDELTVARMQKAISIMQFKSEGRMFARHPGSAEKGGWGLDHRRLLHRIDYAKGTITLETPKGEQTFALQDTRLPTIDPKNPYEYSVEEAACMDRIRESFVRSVRLREHMDWLVRGGGGGGGGAGGTGQSQAGWEGGGGMWTRRDDVLVFHACVPVEPDGTPQPLRIDGRDLAGRELMDALSSVVRRAFRFDSTHRRAISPSAAGGEVGTPNNNPDADWLWYLWGGPRSPLFGKDKLATFETHFIADKETHKEHKNPYFELMHDPEFIKRIGKLFGMGDDVLVVNGHVPVKVEKGENPVKRGGNAVTIDGAFSEAYGDRGYTLVLKPDRIDLAEHAPFSSVADVIDSGADIVPKVETIRTYTQSRTIRETDEGRRTERMIRDLEHLAFAYQEGLVPERA